MRQLREMLDDDSRAVQADARAMLESIGPRVDRRVVDFGRVFMNSVSTEVTVVVSGPPLGRTFTVSASDPALRARRSGQTVKVSIDTAFAAALAGRITVESPAGTAIIEVTADIEPAQPPLQAPAGAPTWPALTKPEPEAHPKPDPVVPENDNLKQDDPALTVRPDRREAPAPRPQGEPSPGGDNSGAQPVKLTWSVPEKDSRAAVIVVGFLLFLILAVALSVELSR